MKTRRSLFRATLASAAMLCALIWSAPLLAAPAPNRVTRIKPEKKEWIITGKIYKPRVFIFVGKPELDLSWSVDDPRFKRSFLERTLDSVWTRPF